jgi:hypothetical protein
MSVKAACHFGLPCSCLAAWDKVAGMTEAGTTSRQEVEVLAASAEVAVAVSVALAAAHLAVVAPAEAGDLFQERECFISETPSFLFLGIVYHCNIGSIGIGSLAGFTGLFMLLVTWFLSRVPLVPKNYSYHDECLNHHR